MSISLKAKFETPECASSQGRVYETQSQVRVLESRMSIGPMAEFETPE